MKVLRWILLLPLSILLAALAERLAHSAQGIYVFFLPAIAASTVNGCLSAVFAGMALIYSAGIIAPSKKNVVVMLFVACGTFVSILQTVLLCILAHAGVVGSCWYPIVLGISACVGLWIPFFQLKKCWTARDPGQPRAGN